MKTQSALNLYCPDGQGHCFKCLLAISKSFFETTSLLARLSTLLIGTPMLWPLQNYGGSQETTCAAAILGTYLTTVKPAHHRQAPTSTFTAAPPTTAK